MEYVESLLFIIKKKLMYAIHRENTRREESKYLECENRKLGLSAIATYIFLNLLLKNLRLGSNFSIYIFRF